MNTQCVYECEFKYICNLDKINTENCKVHMDVQAQYVHKHYVFGMPVEELIARQYKK
jgi:hypothetical protein